MNCKELLSLSNDEQETWLKQNMTGFPNSDHEELIGFIIHCDDYRLKDYIDYPSSYETGSMIKEIFEEISSKREDEINAGAIITEQEKKYLKEAVLDKLCEDEAEGTSYKYCPIVCNDGEVFVTFYSEFQGNAVTWSFDDVHASKKDAVSAIKTVSKDEYFFTI